MILWAKDRLVDAMEDCIYEFSSVKNYAARSFDDRIEFHTQIAEFHRLLTLSEEEQDWKATLAELSNAGYWNGNEDTFWENHKQPSDYKGW